MQVQKFGGCQKHAKFGGFSDNFRLRSRIFPERIERDPKSVDVTTYGCFGRSAIKVGEPWSTNNCEKHVSLDPSKSTFSEDHISAPRGRCWLKFLHTLENDQGFLAHPIGDGGAPNHFLRTNIQKLT